MKTPAWLKLAMWSCAVIAAASLVIAVAATFIASDANSNADTLRTQRTEARVVSCEKDKKFAEAHNALVNFFLSIPEDPADPSPPGLRDRFRDENIVPVPDCSAEGIAMFYAGSTTTVPS